MIIISLYGITSQLYGCRYNPQAGGSSHRQSCWQEKGERGLPRESRLINFRWWAFARSTSLVVLAHTSYSMRASTGFHTTATSLHRVLFFVWFPRLFFLMPATSQVRRSHIQIYFYVQYMCTLFIFA